ncbi:hypothetical protein ANTPLA_LOCUS7619 [Anthophora plagiata]
MVETKRIGDMEIKGDEIEMNGENEDKLENVKIKEGLVQKNGSKILNGWSSVNRRELYNGLAKTQTQRLITEFVLKSTETSAPQEASPNFVQEITERISPMEHEDDNQDISSDSSNIAVLRKRMRLLSESDNE